ncbi:MAG: hypothetical protein ACOC5T_02525 [Elusimicrobiota bacterium]
MEFASTLRVFSVIVNTKNFVKGKKDIDIFKLLSMTAFRKAPKFYAISSKRIYSEISNGYYSICDLAIFLLYQYMMGKTSIKLGEVNYKNLKDFKEMISDKRYNEDLHLLREVYKSLNFKSMKEFFDIKEDGTNVVFELTKKKHISPRFFIKNMLTKNDEYDTINNREYELFKRIANKIKETQRRFLNEQKEIR